VPSPVGHALGGLIVHAAGADRRDLQDWPRIALVTVAACAPDLDRAQSHSLGLAFVAGILAFAILGLRRWPRPFALALLVALGWASHVWLDLFGGDTHPPLGLMALWPGSSAYFKAPVVLFLDIGRTLRLSTVRQNAWEIVLLLPILLAVTRLRRRKS
jgi:hypothetical protein